MTEQYPSYLQMELLISCKLLSLCTQSYGMCTATCAALLLICTLVAAWLTACQPRLAVCNEAKFASAMQQEEQQCHVFESLLGLVCIEG